MSLSVISLQSKSMCFSMFSAMTCISARRAGHSDSKNTFQPGLFSFTNCLITKGDHFHTSESKETERNKVEIEDVLEEQPQNIFHPFIVLEQRHKLVETRKNG